MTPSSAARLGVLLAARASRLALGGEPGPRDPSRRVGAVDSGSSASTVSSSTCAPRRAHRAIDAPSESTPSSECGETTTMGFPDDTRAYDRGLDRLATIRSGGSPPQAASRPAGVRRLAPLAPAEPRRPPTRHADRPQLGLRARHADRPRLRRALRRLAREPTSAAACSRSPRRTTRRASARASSRSTSSWRRRGIRRRRSSATSRTLHRSRTTRFDCAIVTQTLQFVYDVRAALATLHRILAPGGVLLATVPGITKISPPEDDGVRRVVALHGPLGPPARARRRSARGTSRS